MNDAEIRKNFHKKVLRRHHTRGDTLIVDELGLKHGKCRADIAVVNGQLNGFEIKSDRDSLCRLSEQVSVYSAVFDHATILVGLRHAISVQELVPKWWGIILCTCGRRGAINFKTVRRAKINGNVDPSSVAELLWRDEAREVLNKRGVPPRVLRQGRAVLYKYLTDMLDIDELRSIVRGYLKTRKNWRCPVALSPNDG